MKNWFNTLNEALESEDLLETWKLNFDPVMYGQYFHYKAEINGRYRFITIFREMDGRYERPVHYDSGAI